MRLYRTDAGLWCGTQAEAKLAAKADGTRWGLVDVPTDKPGLLAWLNGNPLPGHAYEPHAAVAGTPDTPAAEPSTAPADRSPVDASYAAQSVAIDDAFAALPLSHRLTLAALALEDARSLSG